MDADLSTLDEWQLMSQARHGITYADRKAARRVHFERFQKGRKMVVCCACNGSGYYDHHGSPRCGSCGGTGKVREGR